MHTAVVELDPLTDAVRARAQDHHLLRDRSARSRPPHRRSNRGRECCAGNSAAQVSTRLKTRRTSCALLEARLAPPSTSVPTNLKRSGRYRKPRSPWPRQEQALHRRLSRSQHRELRLESPRSREDLARGTTGSIERSPRSHLGDRPALPQRGDHREQTFSQLGSEWSVGLTQQNRIRSAEPSRTGQRRRRAPSHAMRLHQGFSEVASRSPSLRRPTSSTCRAGWSRWPETSRRPSAGS